MLEAILAFVAGAVGGAIAAHAVLRIERRQRVRRFVLCLDDEVSRALAELPPPRTEGIDS